MDALPTLDAHAHLDARVHPEAYTECGAVLAQTMSLAEAERTRDRQEAAVAFGVGCHPRLGHAEAAFDMGHFSELVSGAALVGEIGLDAGSRVPWERQVTILRSILEVVAQTPRIASIHSYRSTRAILDELRRIPVVAPILHWWTGTVAETVEAVDLGCYFSVHAAVARQTKWRTRVPLDRILVESDHGWTDPPAAIPLRVGWVEHLLGQQYSVPPERIRAAAWANLGRVVEATRTASLLPADIASMLSR